MSSVHLISSVRLTTVLIQLKILLWLKYKRKFKKKIQRKFGGELNELFCLNYKVVTLT